MPHAIASDTNRCEPTAFRIEVFRSEGEITAALTARDLVGVFGAHRAALAITAYLAGDLSRAHRLAASAGGPWSGLAMLLSELTATRRV